MAEVCMTKSGPPCLTACQKGRQRFAWQNDLPCLTTCQKVSQRYSWQKWPSLFNYLSEGQPEVCMTKNDLPCLTTCQQGSQRYAWQKMTLPCCLTACQQGRQSYAWQKDPHYQTPVRMAGRVMHDKWTLTIRCLSEWQAELCMTKGPSLSDACQNGRQSYAWLKDPHY